MVNKKRKKHEKMLKKKLTLNQNMKKYVGNY